MSSDVDNLEKQADAAAASRRFEEAALLLGRAAAAAPERPELWSKLSAMRRVSGNAAGALEAVERCLSLSPLDLTALLARAMILEDVDRARSGQAYCEALAQVPTTEPVPPALTNIVERARRQCARHRSDSASRLRDFIPASANLTERRRIERLISNSIHQTRVYHQEPTHFHFPGLPELEFHDPTDFPGLDVLAGMTDVIRTEFDTLARARGAELVPYIQYPDRIPLRQWQALNQNRAWSAFHLVQNGTEIAANARRCPQTMAALAGLDQPDVPGASPNALFSLLAPRTRIPPHTGVANTRLVAHLPIIVPPNCGFRCGATSIEWMVGKPFVFDDTIEHEAWNDSGELRVVLIVDLWAPRLSPVERSAIAAILAASGEARPL